MNVVPPTYKQWHCLQYHLQPQEAGVPRPKVFGKRVEGEGAEEVVTERTDLWYPTRKGGREAGRLITSWGLQPLQGGQDQV